MVEPNAQFIQDLNDQIFDGVDPAKVAQFQTPRGIISELLPYIFTFAGLILFIMIIWGGMEMLTGASDPKSQEAGKNRIMNAIIGFMLLFCSYFIAQLVELVLRVDIL